MRMNKKRFFWTMRSISWDWYLDQNKVGKTINPDPFTEVVWSVGEEEGKNAKAKRV